MPSASRDTLYFPAHHVQQIGRYLPNALKKKATFPFITLTFATSLDSQLSLAPGVQTALSGPESKAMTHFLRSKHDAILIGVGTAIADNPSLNCRIEGAGGYGGEDLFGQPRPIVIDPQGRWNFTAESKVMQLARAGKGKAPWIVTRTRLSEERTALLESLGGKVVEIEPSASKPTSIGWFEILNALYEGDIESVMIEGGGGVINDLLSPTNLHLVDAVIVTIAPVWLGKGGVQVCPNERIEGEKKLPVGSLDTVKWVPLGEDVVLCGFPKEEAQ